VVARTLKEGSRAKMYRLSRFLTLETTDLKEVKRCRIAQFNGTSRTLNVGETFVTGIVRSIREDKSGTRPAWIITILPHNTTG
jgi:hypothetical protein